MQETRRIADIVIGERHRRDLGDLRALADSIKQVGLLHPPVINTEGILIAGRRRLEALKLLGWTETPVMVLDLQAISRGERDENEVRKDFTPTEAYAIAKALEPMEREAAQDRKAISNAERAKVAPSESGKARDHVAQATGRGRTTIAKIAEVIEAAEAEPERFAGIIEQMDKSGNVNAAVTETKRRIQTAKLEDIATKEAKAIEGVYDVIVIDPPWQMEKIERDERPNQAAFDYPTMTEEQIAALHIPCADDCHVWLWTTHKHLPMAFRVLDAWGLKYVCCMTWCKNGGFQPFGLPQYNSEFCIYARRGTPHFANTNDFKVSFHGDRREHSRKPETFYDTIRRVTAGRRLDMFGRYQISGFDNWGLEAPNGI